MIEVDGPQEPLSLDDLRNVSAPQNTAADSPPHKKLTWPVKGPARMRQVYFVAAIAALLVLFIGLCCLIALVSPLLREHNRTPQVIILDNGQVQTLVQSVIAQTETARSLGLATETPFQTVTFFQSALPVATNNAPEQIMATPLPGLVIPYGCVLWSQVTLEDLGKQMCVAGLASKIEEKEGTLYINPGVKAGDFFFVASDDPQFRELQGHCIVVGGEIKLLDDSPVMVIYPDRLQLCD